MKITLTLLLLINSVSCFSSSSFHTESHPIQITFIREANVNEFPDDYKRKAQVQIKKATEDLCPSLVQMPSDIGDGFNWYNGKKAFIFIKAKCSSLNSAIKGTLFIGPHTPYFVITNE